MLNQQTKEYLDAPASNRRGVLKKQYLASVPSGASERDRALFHLGYLVTYTRRLNMVECKGSSQQIPKPSAMRKTDLLVCVELCAESIRESTFLQSDAEFWRCWTAFEELLERVKSKDGSENIFEASYLLFYLTALIFKRYITDGAVEREPEIFSLEGYTALATGFARPLFESVKSTSDQLENLAGNLRNLARA
jgi:hypothetical protein